MEPLWPEYVFQWGMGQDCVCVGHKDEDFSWENIWCLHGRKRDWHKQKPGDLVGKQYKWDAIENLRYENVKSKIIGLAPCFWGVIASCYWCYDLFLRVCLWLKIDKTKMKLSQQLQDGRSGYLKGGNVCHVMKTKRMTKKYIACQNVSQKEHLLWDGVMGIFKFSTIDAMLYSCFCEYFLLYKLSRIVSIRLVFMNKFYKAKQSVKLIFSIRNGR